jgi:transketolase
VKARVSIEAGIAMPWYKIVGGFGEIISLEHFGESADAATLFREYGFTAEAVVAAAQRSITNVKG